MVYSTNSFYGEPLTFFRTNSFLELMVPWLGSNFGEGTILVDSVFFPSDSSEWALHKTIFLAHTQNTVLQ